MEQLVIVARSGTYYWIGKVNYYNGNQFFCRLAYSSTYDKITLVELSGNIMTTIELNVLRLRLVKLNFLMEIV